MSDNNKTNQEFLDAILQSTIQKSVSGTNGVWGAFGLDQMPIGHARPATAAVPAYAPNNSFTTVASAVNSNYSSGLDLKDGADIKIDGVSLKDFMQQVTLRLNLMVPNPQLERQWDELRTLGEAYRACEKECMDKAKVWDILKRD